MPAERNAHPARYNAIADAIGTMEPCASTTRLRLSSVGPKPMTDGVNVVAMPVACAANSCHQSQSAPSATCEAIRLSFKCAAIAPRMTSASGSAMRAVIAKTPAAIAGAASTRLHPLVHDARIMRSREEAAGQHQLLEPRHPRQRPLRARLARAWGERAAVVCVVD